MTSSDVVATPASAEENIPLSDAALENWHAWCVKWDSVQGKRLYATIMSARARAEAAEAESARRGKLLESALLRTDPENDVGPWREQAIEALK